MPFNRNRLFLAIPAVLLAATAGAQTGRGVLTGTISDAKGVALQGVRVTLQPGDATVTTDATGQYTITGLNAGQYTLTAAYVGFDTLTKPITITAGQTDRTDAALKISSNVQSVQVYAERQGGELEAINRTFNADNIINVLPADVITSLPNANVADAIGRLPSVSLERDEGEGKYVQVRGTEPRLTHTTLDGVNIASPETVRQIKLDIIPADLVESVQINKTLQANQEGDGIGGSVDLRTKSAEDHPTLNFEALGGYNPILGGRGNDQFDGTLGKRFGQKKKLGVLFGGSYDFNGRGINDVEPAPALAGTYDLRDYQYYRDRRGFAGTVDYKFSDTSSIYVKGLYAHFNNFGSDWIYSPAINSFADDTTLTQGGPDGTVSFQVLNRRPVQDIGGLQFGGQHLLRQTRLNYDPESSVGRTRDLGYANGQFAPAASDNPLNNIQYAIDVSHPLTPHLVVQNGVNIFDLSHLFFNRRQVQYTYNPEVDLGFGASVSTPYSFGGHLSTFELGGRFRNVHKFENQDTRVYVPTASDPEDPSLAASNFQNHFSDPGYYGGTYKFGPAVDYNRVRDFAGQVEDPTQELLGNQFNQIEKVSAGYLMNTTDFGKFRVVLGLRIEGTMENLLGYASTVGVRTTTSANGTPTHATNSYISYLPSASVRYALTPTQGLRLVYGRGLSRPNFQDLIPFTSVSNFGSARESVSLGNPLLKTEFADDIDVLYENNLQSRGLLQAGFFYKFLHDPIVATQGRVLGADPSNPALTPLLQQTVNLDSAYLYGFEIAYQQHLTRLPGLLNGTGISANYAFTNSQITLPPASGNSTGLNRSIGDPHPPLVRQAPNTFNVSPTYDKRDLSVRLGITYNQANINAYNYTDDNAGPITQGGGGGGLRGPNGDNYFYSHLQIDLQGTYNLRHGFTLVGYGLNLNNEVFGFYQGSTSFPVQREFYRQTYGGGVRWSPTRER